MSENNTTQTTFVDGLFIREKTFDDGGSILKVAIVADKLTEFLKTYKKADGFVNIVISKKRNPDEKSSHFAKLDTFVPKTQSGQVAPKVQSKPVVKKTAPAPEVDNDDNMF